MSEPARQPAGQLKAVREANRDMHAVAAQALEWVKVAEARVAAAEGATEKARAELKERALGKLREMSARAREEIEAARVARDAAESRQAAAEEALERSERSFEGLRRTERAERERIQAAADERVAAVKAEADRRVAAAAAEADQRVAAAEQRAAEAEAAAVASHDTAVRLETEIEKRVMEGTAEVRREAEESVRKLVEKVEHEAEESARARAEEQLRAESDRIKQQARRREERARAATEDEVRASVSKARREVQAAAEGDGPAWLQSAGPQPRAPAGYRTY